MDSLPVMLVFVLLLSGFLLGMAVSYIKTGVPTISSAAAAHAQISTVLRGAGVSKIYELGAGKGNLAFALAAQIPGAHVEAYELSLLPYLYAQLWKRVHPAGDRVTFHLANFNKIDLSSADAVVFYLMPRVIAQLEPKLIRELKSGSYVATISFAMKNWKPMHKLIADNFGKTRSLVYRMPPEKAHV